MSATAIHLIWMVLLYSLHCNVSAAASGPTCFKCNDVTDHGSCSTVVTCQSDEVCFAERLADSSSQSSYYYGCQKRQVCQAIDSGSGVLGRREMRRDGVETFILACMQCCYTDRCNLRLCQQHSASVPSRPTVVVQPMSTEVVQGRNQDVVFSCSFTGVPTPQILWFYMGSAGKPDVLHGGYTTVGASSNLTIKDPKVSNSGTYICTAINKQGTEKASATLTVHALFKPVVTMSRDQVVDGSPNPLRIHCDSRGSTNASYFWQIAYHGGLIFPMNNTLDTLTYDPPTTTNVGLFTCFVTNSVGQESGSLDVRVEVLEAPDIDVHPSTIIREGDTKVARLSCESRGQHDVSMIWSSATTLLEQASDVNRIAHLIHDPRVQDTGDYTCAVSKDNVTKSASVRLAVYALEPPQVTASGNTLPITLTCNASGTTSPDITWYKVTGGMTQEVTNEVRLLQPFLSTLNVSTLDPHQQPQYECHVTNPVGVEINVFNVTIPEKPYFTTFWQGSLTVHQGQNVTLDCEGRGIPTPSVMWGFLDSSGFPENLGSRDGNILESNNHFRVTILHAVEKNSGVYLCKLSNDAGSISRSVNIQVIP